MFGFTKIPQTIFSGQDYMDFPMADSVLHFNDDKKGYADIFRQMGLDVVVHSHIYYWANDTGKICTSANMDTEKQKKRLDNLKWYKEKTRRTITNCGGACL